MSEENVETVRRAYAEWAQGNLQGEVDLFDPEIVFESLVPDGGSVKSCLSAVVCPMGVRWRR
jgi:ketosteroid isomerase-like protein